jgi:hypothetical protein
MVIEAGFIPPFFPEPQPVLSPIPIDTSVGVENQKVLA